MIITEHGKVIPSRQTKIRRRRRSTHGSAAPPDVDDSVAAAAVLQEDDEEQEVINPFQSVLGGALRPLLSPPSLLPLCAALSVSLG